MTGEAETNNKAPLTVSLKDHQWSEINSGIKALSAVWLRPSQPQLLGVMGIIAFRPIQPASGTWMRNGKEKPL